MPKVKPSNKVGGKHHHACAAGGGGGGEAGKRCKRVAAPLHPWPGIVPTSLLIRMVYAWASHHPGWLTALAVALAMALLALSCAPRDGIIILSGLFPPLSRRHTTFLEMPMDYLEQYYSAAPTAPHISLLLASHFAETAGNKIEVIIVPPAILPHG